MGSEQFHGRTIHCILNSKSFRSVYLQLVIEIGINFIRLNLARACGVINPPMVCIVYGVTIGNIHAQARAGVSGSSIWAPVRRTGTFAAVFVPYLPSFTFVPLRTHTTTCTHRPLKGEEDGNIFHIECKNYSQVAYRRGVLINGGQTFFLIQ